MANFVAAAGKYTDNAMSRKKYRQGYFTESRAFWGALWGVRGVVLIALLTVGLGGCFSRSESESEPVISPSQTLEGPNRLVNSQTNVEITVPTDWIKAGDDLRGDADIYASYPLDNLYASVLSESDSTLDNFSLEDNSDQYRWLIEKELGTYEGATKTDVTQVNGLPAIQYEVRGRIDGTQVVYLHTTVKGNNSYYQVVGWTTAERYAENKETLQSVIRSFDET
ncbi:MAG: hypothetical protein AAF810_13550 [Cyanobacteria bacterium P01_D01_bin.36]